MALRETLEQTIGRFLTKNKKTIAVAESCTGGLLCSRITDVAGSSRYFLMGVVVYSNESKNKILGISFKTIKKYGAVSEDVALLMARRVRSLANTDIGIAITGVAGPSGGTRKKPVGLVYIAVSEKRLSICKGFIFSGRRKDIKYKATQAALGMINAKLI